MIAPRLPQYLLAAGDHALERRSVTPRTTAALGRRAAGTVVAAGRRRPVIRVGTVDERVVFMWPRGAQVAERGHAARRKAPLALRRRKAGGEASHCATFHPR